MKNINFGKIALMLLFGIVIGGGAIGALWYFSTPAGGSSLPAAGPADPTTAHNDLVRYLKALPAGQCPIKGFKFGIDQYNAVKQLYDSNSKLIGFHLYFGKNAVGDNVVYVVGIKADGHDDLNLVLSTGWRVVGPCPPDCDTPNPITD